LINGTSTLKNIHVRDLTPRRSSSLAAVPAYGGDWKATFEKVVIKEKLEPRHVAAARVFLDRLRECR
jgi:hypothetical protein